jgi:hypothetical protein
MAAIPVARPPISGFIRFDRLATLKKKDNEAESSSLAAREFALQGFVSRIAPNPHACPATLMNGLFQR